MMERLPQGWQLAALGEVCDKPQYGWTTKSELGEGLPYLRTTDISSGSINWREVPVCVEEPENVDKYLLRDGDIVVSRAGSVGISHLVRHPPPSVFASYLIRLRPRPEMASSYVAHFLHSPSYWKAISEAEAGIAIPNVNAKKLTAIQIPVPPVSEQRRIVLVIEEHFSRLDAAEAAVTGAKRRLDVLRNVIMDRTFYDDAKSMPTAEIGDLAAVSGGIQKQPKRRPRENRYPFLRVANVGRGHLDLADVHEIELFEGEIDRFRLRKGDLLVVEGNGSVNQIGRAALWGGQVEDCVHQNHLIRVRPGKGILPEYLAHCWNAPRTAQQIQAVASSTSGLYTLSTRKVNSIRIPVVPLSAQRRVVEQLNQQLLNIEAASSAAEDAISRVRALRRAVLAKAFTGQLVPQDPNDEPASALLERIHPSYASRGN